MHELTKIGCLLHLIQNSALKDPKTKKLLQKSKKAKNF